MAMEFLAKLPQIRYSTAALIVFLSAYVTALISAFVYFDTPQSPIARIGIVALSALLFMTLMFMVSWSLKRTDAVDSAWGLVFIVATATAWLSSDYELMLGWNVQTLTMALVLIWGLRLAITITLRSIGRAEDKRYVELRKKWKGNAALNTYLRIFVLQAVLAVIISMAAIVVLSSPPQLLSPLAYAGLAIWLIGFLFEVVGDWQLKQFIKNSDNKGKMLTTGLWAYTRHPNYFGEATMWWGIFIIALSTYFGWIGAISPVVITYLLLFVSGVPLSEASMKQRPGWKKYQARPSKFLPMPPKKV